MPHLYALKTRTNPNAIKYKLTKNLCTSSLTEEESGNSPDGENAIPGPGAANASGLGGLGLEGMVGTEESLGARSGPPGVGNRGVISGDNAGGKEEEEGEGASEE